jgi:hypothetical protein
MSLLAETQSSQSLAGMSEKEAKKVKNNYL